MSAPQKPGFINPDTLARPIGYAHGVVAPSGGRLLFLAGQIGWDGEGRLVSDRLAEQFDRALSNLLTVVQQAGGGPDSIAKLTLFVTDRQEYEDARREIGVRYRARMGRHYPAMTLVEVKALIEPGAKVEIEGIAVIS